MYLSNITKDKKDTKIVVAMSGGVDSSTVAAVLHAEGYNVVGITLQLYDLGVTLEKKGACCAGQDIYDAKEVADKLGIPHYVMDYETIFKQQVMEDFADSYLKGETPIPCVKCNQSVKFRDLFKLSKDLGADALVTGHYIQKKYNNNIPELHMGVDPKKDQSYFLFATTKEQLEYIDFPLGNQSKEETRKLAEKFGLKIADKPDSQDICFVPNGSYASVIEKLRPGALDAGDICDLAGNKLGTHNGIINYTLGQRRGIGIAAPDPLYVVKIDAEKNIVYVGPESALYSKYVFIKELNWLPENDLGQENIQVTVKLRSAHTPREAFIRRTNEDKAIVTLNTPEKAITPGQACVIYDGTRVLGGGWITGSGVE